MYPMNEPSKTKMKITITKFNDYRMNITHEFEDGNKIINATEVSKPFAISVNNSHHLKSSKGYISLHESRYAKSRNGVKSTVLRVVHSGLPEFQGIRMEEKLTQQGGQLNSNVKSKKILQMNQLKSK